MLALITATYAAGPSDTMFFTTADTEVLGGYHWFTSATDVCDYYGSSDASNAQFDSTIPPECGIALEFYKGTPTAANLMFSRMPFGGARARLWGSPITGNLNNLLGRCTPTSKCEVKITYDISPYAPGGYTVDAYFCAENTDTNCGGDSTGNSLANAVNNLNQALFDFALNNPTAKTAGAFESFHSCYGNGYITGGFWEVTSTQSSPTGSPTNDCTLQVGGMMQIMFQSGDNPLEVMSQNTGYDPHTLAVGCHPVGTPTCAGGKAGEYVIWTQWGESASTPPQTIEETWGILTIGSMTSGTIAPGELVAGAGMGGPGIMSNISGGTQGVCTGSACNGSTWIVNRGENVSAEYVNIIPCPLGAYLYTGKGGPDGETDRIVIVRDGNCTYVNPQGTMNFATGSGTGSNLLGIAQGSTGNDSGGVPWGSYLSPCSQAFPIYWVNSTFYRWLYFFSTNSNVCPQGAPTSQTTGAFTYFQIGVDPDGGLTPPVKKNAIQSFATAYGYHYISNFFGWIWPEQSFPPPGN
jgi:hypothetical protein